MDEGFARKTFWFREPSCTSSNQMACLEKLPAKRLLRRWCVVSCRCKCEAALLQPQTVNFALYISLKLKQTVFILDNLFPACFFIEVDTFGCHDVVLQFLNLLQKFLNLLQKFVCNRRATTPSCRSPTPPRRGRSTSICTCMCVCMYVSIYRYMYI